MLFYKIEARMANMSENPDSDKQEQYASELQAKLLDFHQKQSKDWLVYISSMRGNMLTMGAIMKDRETLDGALQGFLKAAGIGCEITDIDEITFQVTKSLLRASENKDYIKDDNDVYKQFGLYDLARNSRLNYTETMLTEKAKKKDLKKKAEHLLCSESVTAELTRIYQPAAYLAAGHPVHYLIQAESYEVSDSICDILLSALNANRRVKSRRYSSVWLNDGSNSLDEDEYLSLYKSCTGGAVILKCYGKETDEDNYRNSGREQLEIACRIARKYRNDTLTIFCLPRAAEKRKASLKELLGTITLVELTEDAVSSDRAKAYLRRSAHKNGVKPDKSLFQNFEDKIKTYSPSELNRSFEIWYDNRLKNYCYPQYASFESVGQSVAKKKPRGQAYEELESLIGLTEAKLVIKQAVDYFKAKKLFGDKGFDAYRPSLHMVFTGSPGTAKTTAARLFAQIMKDNGLLSVGGLYEVGRADLVGKYVGWTAKIVKEKFRSAMGSVLFIDEAYSLVDDRDGSYGDEAINTIVAEMENRREDIVVIFAGYPDKMETFLQKNPGLRSRIAFHVPFSDYKPEELLQILELIANKQSAKLDVSVRNKVLPIMTKAMEETDFGNGRFVRNLYEKARMKQASRLLSMNTDQLTKDDVGLLLADDFEVPNNSKLNRVKRIIGFSEAV